MNDKLCILICESFKVEAESMLGILKNGEIEFKYYSMDCINCRSQRQKLYDGLIASGYCSDSVILLPTQKGSGKDENLAGESIFNSCLSLLAGGDLIITFLQWGII